jgi:putative transposase
MKRFGLRALYAKPWLSKPSKAHKKYPYLLKGKVIRHPNQVWASDITYIRLPGGHAYLVVILDLYSRKVLSWRLSNTLDAGFCVAALEEAIERYGEPAIFNTDQGCQFTAEVFIKVLEDHNIEISMDGKGRALDNIYVERLWRSLKYEDIYLKSYESMEELNEGVGRYFVFYNTERFHQSLEYQTPEIMHESFSSREDIQIAA